MHFILHQDITKKAEETAMDMSEDGVDGDSNASNGEPLQAAVENKEEEEQQINYNTRKPTNHVRVNGEHAQWLLDNFEKMKKEHLDKMII